MRFELWFPVLLMTPWLLAAERPTVELAPPLVGTPAASDRILRDTRESGKAYLIDLASAAEGLAFRAKPDLKLAPGRYRLHVLVAAGPGGNDVVGPVELLLTAGNQTRHVLPRELPKTGELADLWLDFAVAPATAAPVCLKWFVGDSLLDVPAREKAKALQNLLKRRAAATMGGGHSPGDQEAADDVALDEETSATLVPLATTRTPKYRLAIAGMHVETLCPVGIDAVRPDRAAYEPGESARLEVSVRNYSGSEVQATLTAELTPADKAEAGPPVERRTATLTVPAGGALTHKFPDAFSTAGLTAMTRVSVRVASQDTRPATDGALFALAPAKRPAKPVEKKIFAHYMGCWPIGMGALFYQRQTECQGLLHDRPASQAYRFGGHVRNFDLVDPAKELTPEQSADLEIRRAMRIGIDGFAIDAWAGDKGARATLDALFKVAEAKDYPFQLTVCIDPTCGGSIVDTVKEVLAKHGTSPKLARRDGKPLIFGYQSVWGGFGLLTKYAPDRIDAVRTQPIGWHIMGQSLTDAARQVGQPIYYHYCLDAFFYGVERQGVPKDGLTQAAGVIARYADAVGGFGWLGPEQPAIGQTVRAAGAEWSIPNGMYQKENIPFECYVPKGTDWLHWGQAALDQGATLIQIVTWNDYGENTNIAPAWNTRYTIYDLTGYEIKLWKTGAAPAPDHDRVYLIYRKYPPGAKIFPFAANFTGVEGGAIEVLTMLPKPGHIRLPGRQAEYDAPAGFFRKQFPVTAGPMIAELVRDGKVDLRLESPEPITDRPFREDHAVVCWSSEEERLWREDFGNTKPFWYSEYGDVDKDGLPNWLVMSQRCDC